MYPGIAPQELAQRLHPVSSDSVHDALNLLVSRGYGVTYEPGEEAGSTGEVGLLSDPDLRRPACVWPA